MHPIHVVEAGWHRFCSVSDVTKRAAPRSSLEKTAARVERRLKEIEDLARANRRELEIQFRRMSAIQEQLDRLSAAIGKR